MKPKEKLSGTRLRLYEIIFEADTKAGKRFDIILLSCIIASVIIIILESVQVIKERFGYELRVIEWIFTIIFTLEYLGRFRAVPFKKKYVFSFFWNH